MSPSDHLAIGLLSLAIIIATVAWIRGELSRFRQMTWFTVVITFVLVVLGAYVRLSDAGLGCPDWPGCYGNLTPAHASEQIQAAEVASPGGPVSAPKAWKEMVHRYLAGIVGSLIFGLAFASWRWRRALERSPALPSLLVVVVAFQAALGAWTVTMLLKPAIVTGHLIGGMTTLALLLLLALRQTERSRSHVVAEVAATSGIRWAAAFALLIVIGQIILGGWVSTNYAALACTDFPLCQGRWIPEMDFSHGFHVRRELGMTAAGELLTVQNLTAIHWVHRVGALITALVVGSFALHLMGRAPWRRWGLSLLTVLILQISFGIANVLGSLPLPVAVAHNAGAALLLCVLVMLNYRVSLRA